MTRVIAQLSVRRGPEAIEFYEGLEADNSKSYWQAHKPFYEASVKGPMEALLAELRCDLEALILEPV